MAPEQLAGGAASVQSDLYALGLVLYELFTGKRAFDSPDPAVIRRLQADSSPKSPSSLTPDIEPAVERVVMRCLEREPRDRPVSAYAVLGALPGGDPLAAALAAGETPSPELVANARVAGGLKPAVAIACIAFVLATFGWWAGVEQSLPRGFTRSETTLALRAEDVLAKAGIANPPRYAYGGFDQNRVYNAVRARMDSTAVARGRPKQGTEMTSLYWRRFSPERLVNPSLHDAIPRLFQPPQALPGSAMVLMEPDGKLILFQMVPDAGRSGATDSLNAGDRAGQAAVDWPALVSAGGYDATRMTRVAPSAAPGIRTDSVTAWSVPGRRPNDRPVTLLAGWLGGKVVHVSIDSDWGTSVDPFAFRSPPPGDSWFYLCFWVLIPTVAGVFFGVRNLRAGRGDRRGATVLAVFVFACYWIAHFIVQDVGRAGILEALDSMLDNIPIGHALLHAVSVWFVYVALEPYLRRLWPRVLVSWARLVTGRYRDPLIGRDIVIGFVFAGADAALTLAAQRLAPTVSTRPPFQIFDSLAGTGLLLGSLLYNAAISVLIALGFFSVLLLARLTLRRNDLAVAAAILVIALGTYSGNAGDVGPIRAIAAAVGSAGLAMVGVRFGLLAGIVGAFVRVAIDIIPWTMDLSVWYSGRMILVLAVLAALLIYGLAAALAGRSIFKDPIQEGAGV
jgi:hypothetical protein